jgi:hypothetical protein
MKQDPSKIFSFENIVKVHRARSGRYNICSNTGIKFLAKNCIIEGAVSEGT